jgi:hypothetical protein
MKEHIPGKEVDGKMRNSPGEYLGKNNNQYQHGKEGIENTPKVAQNTPAVFQFNVPGYQLEKKFPISHEGMQTHDCFLYNIHIFLFF